MKCLPEEMQLAIGFVPVDLKTAANAGDYVSLKNYRHVDIVFIAAAGDAAEPPTITLEQASAVAGTGVKALAIPRGVYIKDGADLQTIGTFTKVAATTSNTYALAAGNTQKIVVIPLNAEDLDADGGFDCLRASVADVGAVAQLGTLFYLLSSPRYTPPPSAIVD